VKSGVRAGALNSIADTACTSGTKYCMTH
jgi:hypothetical protein